MADDRQFALGSFLRREFQLIFRLHELPQLKLIVLSINRENS